MSHKNPAWHKAESDRQAAETAYTTFMKDPATLLLREDHAEEYQARVAQLNAAIEAANRQVRITPEMI